MQQNPEEDVSTATATQTEEEDSGDSVILNQLNGVNGAVGPFPGFNSHQERGFLLNLITRVLPSRRRQNSLYADDLSRCDRRTICTQTEEQDPVTARGQQLAYLVIQELALDNRSIPSSSKDDVYESLCNCVCEILDKHSILFNGMVNRIDVTSYRVFESVANELFETNANGNPENETGPVQLRITWGRVISLFAFAVRLVQEYRENQDRVDEVTRYLASYVSKHVIPFVRMNGRWAGLVEAFPAPVDLEAQVRRAVMWSGLCVGLVATMYVSSLLR